LWLSAAAEDLTGWTAHQLERRGGALQLVVFLDEGAQLCDPCGDLTTGAVKEFGHR
jgi:hypothetical protein